MKKYILIVSLIVAAMIPAAARSIVSPDSVTYTSYIEKEGNTLHISLDIELDELRMSSQEMLVLTPVILTPDSNQLHLAPAVVVGTKRHRALKRLLDYGNPVFEQTPQVLVRHEKRSGQSLTLTYAIPFDDCFYGADLYVFGNGSGCAGCGNVTSENLIEADMVLAPFVPQYMVSYIVPEAEVKERSETFVARINYVVDRYELLPDFKNNATVLREVDAVVRELQNDPDLTITHHTVTGYASPEGNWNSNITLSKNRAGSFMNYLQQKYNWDTAGISHQGEGEDWDGLRQAVLDTPDLPCAGEVIDIIDNTPDIARRKKALKALEGGRVYARLLAELYPPLRRNEFKISYIARPFNVDEAREIIRTRPHLLSLNEMFLVANSYPKESEEFKEVFDVAVRMFPHSEVSRINAAAMELETGSVERAARRLADLNTPEALNNLGVAYARSENPEAARACFEQAMQAGNEQAAHNLEQLNQTEKGASEQ